MGRPEIRERLSQIRQNSREIDHILRAENNAESSVNRNAILQWLRMIDHESAMIRREMERTA